MVKNLEDIQKLSRDNMDATLKSFGAVTKGVQALVAEAADYSKKTFETNTATVEKLIAVRSVDKALEVQTDYVKSAYDSFVAEATKFGELFSAMATETYKPFESYMATVSASK